MEGGAHDEKCRNRLELFTKKDLLMTDENLFLTAESCWKVAYMAKLAAACILLAVYLDYSQGNNASILSQCES